MTSAGFDCGTTALVAYLMGNRLYVANVGDSRYDQLKAGCRKFFMLYFFQERSFATTGRLDV